LQRAGNGPSPLCAEPRWNAPAEPKYRHVAASISMLLLGGIRSLASAFVIKYKSSHFPRLCIFSLASALLRQGGQIASLEKRNTKARLSNLLVIILRFHRTRIINSSSIASAKKQANKQTNKYTAPRRGAFETRKEKENR
jgi:hypothetical protein